jgi:diketogulonate reductase-like aldo/keto reductase
MKKLTDCYILNNGVAIPCVGFGTWQTPDGETAVNSVKAALAAGYRHIDTAAIYGNEVSVGKAIAESGVAREDIFVTSKVWNKCRGYETTLAAFDETLEKLGLDYLDLYLIHWPANKTQFENWDEINRETWRAMTELYKAGKIRAIGVSNFLPHHLESLVASEVVPAINQIEFHPGQMQAETVEYCRAHGILVEAWSPLGTGRMLTNETLIEIASHYSVSVAQLCIRWCLQNGTLPLPKSVTPSRIEQNTQVFDFVISDEDMATINAMAYCGGSGHNPDTVTF